MPSDLDLRLDAIRAELTGQGAVFETVMVERDGRNFPAFLNAPRSLPALFAQFCELHGDREFLVDGESRLSFAETHHIAARVAQGLVSRHGVRPGERIGIAARNSANWVIAYMGVLMAGGCATLLNGWWLAEEMAAAIALAGCGLVIADAERAARIGAVPEAPEILVLGHGDPAQGLKELIADGQGASELPQPAPEDLATILFTSGSTSQARAAFSDHRAVVNATLNYALQSAMLAQHLGETGSPPSADQASLLSVPLFHVTGEVPLLLQSFVIGRKLVAMAKWDAVEAMRLIESERVTYFVGVPLMSHEIATHPDRVRFDLSSCRNFAAGGAPRPVDHVPVLRQALPDGWPLIGYGLTETNAVGCINVETNYTAKPASTGPASAPLSEVAILGADGRPLAQGQTGEVAIRSICNFQGYWNDAEGTARAMTADGWFLTGDLGYLDPDRYLFIVDRKKDVIIRGGENIACAEVEQAIYAHPAVAEAAVFGQPDARFGEVPVAVYRPRPGETLEPEALRAHLGAHLAAFKLPVRLWCARDPLPRLGSEKIDKRALRSNYPGLDEQATQLS